MSDGTNLIRDGAEPLKIDGARVGRGIAGVPCENRCKARVIRGASSREASCPRTRERLDAVKCATVFLRTFIEGALLPHELARTTTRGRSDCSSSFPSRKEEFDSPSLRSGAFCSSSTHRGRLSDELCTMCDSLFLP